MRVDVRLSFALGAALAVLGCDGANPQFVGDDMNGGDLASSSGSLCGNGVIDPGEYCDDGPNNGAAGDGCKADCTPVCTVDASCDDHDPCNGQETCSPQHACLAGTAAADGTPCGTGSVCKNAACTPDSCGDALVETGEECDDGAMNGDPGDGCTTACKFTCVSTDQTRNCTPADPCAGQGTCNDATHVCAPGTALTDGTACPGTNHFCKTGVCTAPSCGNSVVEPGEDCDDGANNGTTGDGCKANCTFACVNPASDCPAPPACELESCTAAHVCLAVADATQDGHACGTNLVCKDGACIAPSAVCGNGVVETGEQCDFGAGNGPGTGCESNCTFSCTLAPNSCDDGNPCDGAETCGAVTVGGHAGQKCSPGTAEADGTACGTGQICLAKECKTSACGDGFVDTSRGEQCDPPNGTTCDATCKNVVCGDGKRGGKEQCDDGNKTDLDGCDHACNFEQDQRVNWLQLPMGNTATDTYCTINALGAAIVGGIAQNDVQMSLTNGVGDGSITIAFKMFGLTDLSGVQSQTVMMGLVGGTPAAAPGGVTYSGAKDLDWWYTVDPNTIDGTRTPKTLLTGTVASQVLNGTAATVPLTITIAGAVANLTINNVKMTSSIGATSKPTVSGAAMTTPGHLATENLDPALVSYASAGLQTAAGGAKLCGNVTALSLSQVKAPTALVGCGLTNCTQCFTATNTLLDVLVSGCGSIIGTQIRAVQPDQSSTPGVTYKLTLNGTHQVTGCTDNKGNTVALATCLAAAEYSSYFRFTTDRVIVK
jgi:cysteine-rich repeat protein